MRAVLTLLNFLFLAEQLPELDKKREDSRDKLLRQRKKYEGEDRQNDHDITEMWQQMAKLQDYENKVSRSRALLPLLSMFSPDLCVCVCVCVYTVCTHMCVYVCMYIYTHRRTNTHTHT